MGWNKVHRLWTCLTLKRSSTKACLLATFTCVIVFFTPALHRPDRGVQDLQRENYGSLFGNFAPSRRAVVRHELAPLSCGKDSSRQTKKKRALVTGVAGFVGSHVAEKVAEQGLYDVFGVDDLSAFGEHQLVNVPRDTIFLRGDLKSISFIRCIFHEYGPFETVYHIAAYGGQGMSNFIRNSLYSTNVLTSANLINAAVNSEAHHFVFISSCAVYGSQAEAPLLEDAHVHPDDPYGISKFTTEMDLNAAHKQFGLAYTIFRAHNLYGPRQFLNDPFRNVLSIWMRQVLLGHEITIFGDGSQTRSFTYIDDVSTMIAKSPFVPGARNKIINAGSVKSVKLLDCIKSIGLVLGLTPQVKFLPVRRETNEVDPDHKLQLRIFGEQTFTDINTGLQHMADWARTLDWASIGEAPHVPPEVTNSMPASWLGIFDVRGEVINGYPAQWTSVQRKGAVTPHLRGSLANRTLFKRETTPTATTRRREESPLLSDNTRRIGPHTIRPTCRFDGHPLIKVIDFGLMPLGNNFLPANSSQADFDNEFLYPLTVGFDPVCGSFQVNVMPEAQEGVWRDYFYFSSVIHSLALEFERYASEFIDLFQDPKQTSVVEIGCNDGVFLKPLAKLGFHVIGVDPASNVVKKLGEEGYTVYNDFFGTLAATKILKRHGTVDAIVTSNSFAHIDDMQDVMRGILLLLKPNGVLAIQVHYAVSMVEKMQYDWIYHEHLSYYTLYSLTNFLVRNGLHVFDALQTPMHGGSIRVFVQRKEGGTRKETESLRTLQEKEVVDGVHKLEYFQRFEMSMAATRTDLRNIISKFRAEGKTIIGYGAPARATTLSGYIGIPFVKENLIAIIDDSPAKQGAFMPGTHLKIVSSSVLTEGKYIPECVLLFAWPWVKDIVSKNTEYLRNGGVFIIPLPRVEIIDKLNMNTYLQK